VTLRIPRIRVLAAALALTTAPAFALGAATDADADQSRVTIHRVTIPAAHFQPTSSLWTYVNAGDKVYSTAGNANFLAPIPYSYDGTGHVFITRVELLAYDDAMSSSVCANLWRGEPGIGGGTLMGSACTLDSANDPQSVVLLPAVRRVNAGQRAYLLVALADPSVDLYGVRVTYTTNP